MRNEITLPKNQPIMEMPHLKQWRCFIVCASLWKYFRDAAKTDWLNMVMPSIFTKTFGRILMVSQVIHYTTFQAFFLKNLIYAAPPIAVISAMVVFFYRLSDQYLKTKTEAQEQGKEWTQTQQKEALWGALKFAAFMALKTAIKFFILYMGWATAMGLVAYLGWFVGPMAPAVMITLASCLLMLLLTGVAKYLIYKFNGSKLLENIINVLIITLIFAAIATLAYFASPLLASLLVVGGVSALSLFCASLITDVLLDDLYKKGEGNLQKAWRMLSRAYSEGAIWALVEHIGINVLIGGIAGGIIDVVCVCAAVCSAIFLGGAVDSYFRHIREHFSQKLKGEDEKKFVKEKIREIHEASILSGQGQIINFTTKIRKTLITHGKCYLFEKFIKCDLGLKILDEIETESNIDIDIRIKRLERIVTLLGHPRAKSWLPFSICYGDTATKNLLNRVIKAKTAYINTLGENNLLIKEVEKAYDDEYTNARQTLTKWKKNTASKIEYKYGIAFDLIIQPETKPKPSPSDFFNGRGIINESNNLVKPLFPFKNNCSSVSL